MTLAKEIIYGREPNYQREIGSGRSLDDIDEYGFTPLIESIIARRPMVMQALLEQKVDVNKPDILGRTPLHWAVDQGMIEVVRFLLSQGANPNAYDRNGLSVLVYPLLRDQNELKHLLYQFGGKVDFSLDFIHGKLLGHRFELIGHADILTTEGEFITLDYEGFILEFTVAAMKDALRRYMSSYSTRKFRHYFDYLNDILEGFIVAEALLKLQHIRFLTPEHDEYLLKWLHAPILILPAASRGHAMCFVRVGQWWIKIDRGENSQKEGSVNIYTIGRPECLTVSFLKSFLYQRQPRSFFHKKINTLLGLKPYAQLPMSSQIVGNCSWANVQAIIPATYVALQLRESHRFNLEEALFCFDHWAAWDQDRALDECVQRFYLANAARKASLAGMLAAVLFQSCHASNPTHLKRAEKIVPILLLPEYRFILKSYLTVYCTKKPLSVRGDNLLKIFEDLGLQPPD